ncbi:sugar-transfer associated ATP-grasp domain-containing protein [Modestobacter lacusdianchii]
MRLERRQYVGALHPSMWRRGFLSNRRYAYPGIEDRSLPYISDLMVEPRLASLNDASARKSLDDKALFADALIARGLADQAPETFGAVIGGTFRPRSPRALERLREQRSVIVKPANGDGGRGVRALPGSEVADLHEDAAPEQVVQERLQQHPALAAVNPGSLNTMRVLAIRLPADGPVVVAAVHRWGTAATGAVDNVSSGGLCSLIDLETGRLGPALGAPRDRRRVPLDRHPDTGAQITGLPVPCWPEVRQLTLSLMDAFPDLDHVGWDICVTAAGPRVIEGNPGVPNPNVFQFHGPFLHDSRIRRYYIDHGILAPRYA